MARVSGRLVTTAAIGNPRSMPRVSPPKRVDVCVVGAGVMGSSAALATAAAVLALGSSSEDEASPPPKRSRAE